MRNTCIYIYLLWLSRSLLLSAFCWVGCFAPSLDWEFQERQQLKTDQESSVECDALICLPSGQSALISCGIVWGVQLPQLYLCCCSCRAVVMQLCSACKVKFLGIRSGKYSTKGWRQLQLQLQLQLHCQFLATWQKLCMSSANESCKHFPGRSWSSCRCCFSCFFCCCCCSCCSWCLMMMK